MTASERPLAWAIAVLCTTYVLGALLIQPSLFPDASYGLLIQKSMDHGAPWNHLTEPRADDIARDRAYFHTWWSPGQYAVPAALRATGLAWGDALKVLGIVASLAGLFGWFVLFRALGFARVIAIAACTVIAGSRSFGFSFVTYAGSDLLLFAAFPYFALLLYRLRGTAWLALASPFLVVGGFYLKNSMAIHVLCWIGAVVAVFLIRPRPRSLSNVALAALALGLAGLAVLLLNQAYLARGSTPMTYAPRWAADARVLLLPPAMPLLAGTGIDDLLSRLFSHPSGPLVDYKGSLLLLGTSLAATAWIAFDALSQPRQRDTATMMLLYIGAVVLVFTYFLATGAGAAVDFSRHYLVPGYVLLPLALTGVARLRAPIARYGVVGCLLVPATYGVLSFGANWKRHFDRRASHSDQLKVTHPTLTPRVVQFLGILDRDLPGNNSLAVVPIPAMALEFSRTRVLATSVTSEGVTEIRRAPRKGRVENLVVIAELAGQTPEEIEAWLASFESYPAASWEVFEADGFQFYVPAGQAVDGRWLSQRFPKQG